MWPQEEQSLVGSGVLQAEIWSNFGAGMSANAADMVGGGAGHDVWKSGQGEDSSGQDESVRCSECGGYDVQSLRQHLATRALDDGRYSDVTIVAFGTKYALHRIILDRSEYFKTLFDWEETRQEAADAGSSSDGAPAAPSGCIELNFDDEYITRDAFELAMARLYGSPDHQRELSMPLSMIAVGSFLALDDVVRFCTDHILEQLDMNSIPEYTRFAATRHYGRASDAIIDSSKGILCSIGWESAPHTWDDIPAEIIADVVGEDCFFVPTEYDRCLFIISLIGQRTRPAGAAQDGVPDGASADGASPDDVSPDDASPDDDDAATDVAVLRKCLAEKVHFCHMTAEQMDEIANYNDVNGVPFVDTGVLQSALWQSFTLQRTIKRSPDVPCLKLPVTTGDRTTGESNAWHRVPVRDETIFGNPTQVRDQISDHQYSDSYAHQALDEGEFKASSTSTDAVSAQFFSWSKIPPCRFSIAFTNASTLGTDTRVYTKTIWYAGSYWNMYLQKARSKQKKGFQVGVYLHRASGPSPTRNGIINNDISHSRASLRKKPVSFPRRDSAAAPQASRMYDFSPKTYEMEYAEDESVSKDFEGLQIQETGVVHGGSEGIFPRESAPGGGPFAAYEDQRYKIAAYFVISTPSRKTKASITTFVSAPATFTKSQSWGWKSNSMCVFNEDGTFPKEHEQHLKFMVVLGVI